METLSTGETPEKVTMFQYVPAQAGWYVLSIVGGVEFRRNPIIAWKIESDGAGPMPVTLGRLQISLDATHVIVAPDGKVMDNEEGRGKSDTVEDYIQRVQAGDDIREEQEREQKAKQPRVGRLIIPSA